MQLRHFHSEPGCHLRCQKKVIETLPLINPVWRHCSKREPLPDLAAIDWLAQIPAAWHRFQGLHRGLGVVCRAVGKGSWLLPGSGVGLWALVLGIVSRGEASGGYRDSRQGMDARASGGFLPE